MVFFGLDFIAITIYISVKIMLNNEFKDLKWLFL